MDAVSDLPSCSLEDEVFRSMKINHASKTPYSDATQVSSIEFYSLNRFKVEVTAAAAVSPSAYHPSLLKIVLY